MGVGTDSESPNSWLRRFLSYQTNSISYAGSCRPFHEKQAEPSRYRWKSTESLLSVRRLQQQSPSAMAHTLRMASERTRTKSSSSKHGIFLEARYIVTHCFQVRLSLDSSILFEARNPNISNHHKRSRRDVCLMKRIFVSLFLIALSTLVAVPALNVSPVRASTSPSWSFRDDFNYTSISQVSSATITLSSGGSATSTLTIEAQNSKISTTYPINVTGTSGSLSISATVEVTVTPAHAPIIINGNSGFTAANGVSGGSGTASDPYIISGWNINGWNYPSAWNPPNATIAITNPTSYFVIQNVVSSGAGIGPGIRLNNGA